MLLYIANVEPPALTVCAHLPLPLPAPSPPRQFTVTSPTPFSLQLSWMEPLDDGGDIALVSVCMYCLVLMAGHPGVPYYNYYNNYVCLSGLWLGGGYFTFSGSFLRSINCLVDTYVTLCMNHIFSA